MKDNISKSITPASGNPALASLEETFEAIRNRGISGTSKKLAESFYALHVFPSEERNDEISKINVSLSAKDHDLFHIYESQDPDYKSSVFDSLNSPNVRKRSFIGGLADDYYKFYLDFEKSKGSEHKEEGLSDYFSRLDRLDSLSSLKSIGGGEYSVKIKKGGIELGRNLHEEVNISKIISLLEKQDNKIDVVLRTTVENNDVSNLIKKELAETKEILKEAYEHVKENSVKNFMSYFSLSFLFLSIVLSIYTFFFGVIAISSNQTSLILIVACIIQIMTMLTHKIPPRK